MVNQMRFMLVRIPVGLKRTIVATCDVALAVLALSPPYQLLPIFQR